MSEPIKMSPCPFCGGHPILKGRNVNTGEVFSWGQQLPGGARIWSMAHAECSACEAIGYTACSGYLASFRDIADMTMLDVMMYAASKWNDRSEKGMTEFRTGEWVRDMRIKYAPRGNA